MGTVCGRGLIIPPDFDMPPHSPFWLVGGVGEDAAAVLVAASGGGSGSVSAAATVGFAEGAEVGALRDPSDTAAASGEAQPKEAAREMTKTIQLNESSGAP